MHAVQMLKRSSKKTALTQTVEEYASRSSIHGIGYVFDRDLNIVDRLLWLFVVIALLGGAAVFTWDFWSQWRDEQVIFTKVKKTDFSALLNSSVNIHQHYEGKYY